MSKTPERLSQTLLRTADNCPHAAYLYMKHGSTPSLPKHRGTLFHVFAERAMWTLIENGESSLYAAAADEDPLHAKQQVASLTAAIVDEAHRAHPELTMTAADRDDVREMAYHWAVGFDVPPERVVSLEQKFFLDVGGWTLSGKLDVLSTCEDPGVDIVVSDYKTSFLMASWEDFERTFQTKLYAAFVAFGTPVERDVCPECEGTAKNGCEACSGRGYTETLGDPIGRGFNRFRIREVYPRYLDPEGTVRYRSLDLTRTELHDFMVDVEALVARVDSYVESEEWPAVPGSHCKMCPAWTECPIPVSLREPPFDSDAVKDAGGITSQDEALRDAERWFFLDGLASAIKKRLRGWSQENGPVPIGSDLELAIVPKDSTTTDWDGFRAAQAEGRVVDIAAFQKKRAATEFRKRKVKPEEDAA